MTLSPWAGSTLAQHLRHLAALLALCTLTACGGGGSAGPAPTPNTAPLARPGADQSTQTGTSVTLDGSASTDPEGDPITHAWILATRPAGSAATLSAANTARPSFTPDVAGSYVLSLTVNDGRLNSAPASLTVLATAPLPPDIVLSAAEPLADTVNLALSRAVTGTVSWYVDLQLIGTVGEGSSAPLSWNTRLVGNGQHLLSARIQAANGSTQELRRTVQVANNSITLSAVAIGRQNPIYVEVMANSPYDINQVTARFDNTALPTLMARNGCRKPPCGPGAYDVYRWDLPPELVISGPHKLTFVATDGRLDSRSLTLDLAVSNAPTVNLPTPAEGAPYFGSLPFAGTVATDKNTVVTTIVRFRDLEVLRTTARSFEGSIDLRGLAPGVYPLFVQVTDSDDGATRTLQRNVVVTATP